MTFKTFAVAGCAAGSTAPVGEPVPDPAGTAVELAVEQPQNLGRL